MSTKRQSGFTLVEMIVVIVVVGIMIGMVFGTMDDFYTSNTNSVTQTVQTADTRSVLRSIEEDLTNANGFLTASSVAIATPTGADNLTTAWSYKGNDAGKPLNRVLIANAYATDLAASNANRSLAYTTADCNAATGTPAQVNYIYFVKQNTVSGKYDLYRRTMVPANICTPPGAFQKQSCASTKVSLYPAVCKASDAVLLYDVSNFTVDYYPAANSATAITDQYGAGDITVAKSIKVKVTTDRKINGVLTPLVSEIRISRFN
jgi:prepilin-type N-terminal cleavage/methylation domain-containing protein